MTHEDYRGRIGALLDGELGADDTVRVEQHLAGCASCRVVRDELAALSRAMRDLPRDTMPADLRASIMRRARSADAAPGASTWFRRPWVLASTASAAMLLAVVVIAWRSGETGMITPGVPPPTASIPSPASGGQTGRTGEANLPTPLPATEGAEAEEAAGAEDNAPPAQASPVRAPKEELSAPSRERAAPIHPSAPPVAPESRDAAGEPEKGQTPYADAAKLAAGSVRQDKPSGPGYYTMTMTRTRDGGLGLGPLRPERTSTAAPGTGDSMKDDPSVRRLVRNAPAAPAADAVGSLQKEAVRYDGPSVTLSFLLGIDDSGVVVSADPVGARLVPVATMRAITALLVGSTMQPHMPDDPQRVAIQVTLPAAP